jgi:anion-transporting  ArsA/GET3 family ATPase
VRPLQIVTGKGGVGKSTFAAAIALAAAREGERVLVIEMGGPGGIAGLFGVRPVEHGVPVTAAPNVSLAYYDGEAALAEYLLRRMPIARMMNALLAHPLYRAFVNAGPGVRELMAVGKVRDELLGLETGKPRWDRLVVDAGASGHALQLLGMPSAAARTFRAGLAHREATRVAKFLADRAITAVHVVALPEEMPLEEAAEIVAEVRRLALPIGRLVVNQCRPRAPEGAAAAVRSLEHGALADAARRALGWLRVQEDGIARLEARTELRAERLAFVHAEPFGRAEVAALATELRA